VQEVPVEEHDRARGHLDRHRVGVSVGEVVGLDGAVESLVVVFPVGVDDATRVGARQHPEAAVVDGGVVERDPGGGQ
jgi:hypothetical protein